MSKYTPLWEYVQAQLQDKLVLSFAEIEGITGVSIDHSFLTFKKELTAYGYRVDKISLKEKTVFFVKI